MAVVALLTKGDEFGRRAAEIARTIFDDPIIHFGQRGEDFPYIVDKEIISFLSPLIVPSAVLDNSRLAINFHPGSRDYPGATPYNFALYEEAETYGCLCHYMTERVDAGAIIAERTFRIFPSDTVHSLRVRTLTAMLGLFVEICDHVAVGESLPLAHVPWSRKPTTVADLEALCRITPDMPEDEVRRRVRATTYPGKPGARVELSGTTFEAQWPI